MWKLATSLLSIDQKLASPKTYREERDAILEFGHLLVPDIKITGSAYPPPLGQSRWCHPDSCQSCVWRRSIHLIMSGMDWHDESAIPIKLSGFTYNSFQYVPAHWTISGSKLGRAWKRRTRQSYRTQNIMVVRSRISTPGCFFQKEHLWTRSRIWSPNNIKNLYRFLKKIGFIMFFYPRVGCIEFLLADCWKKVETYCGYNLLNTKMWIPRQKAHSFIQYPSMLYGCLVGLGVPSLHARVENNSLTRNKNAWFSIAKGKWHNPGWYASGPTRIRFWKRRRKSVAWLHARKKEKQK